MTEEITKQDWIRAKEQFQAMRVNALVNVECYNASLKVINEKIKEFPDDKPADPMPEEIKEMVK